MADGRRYSPAVFAEFPITLADPTVWLSIGQGLLVGAVCLLFGIWVARFVGLLAPDAPAGETLGVGLASGLLVLAAWWAAIASGGRSSFTPVAVGFAHRDRAGRRPAATGGRRDGAGSRRTATRPTTDADGALGTSPEPRRRPSSAAPCSSSPWPCCTARRSSLSPRDGVQPLEVMDEAYYSVLGADLAETGTETIYSPSGFTEIDGLPDPDLVPLGRDVAGRGRHHDLRHGAARCPPLRRAAAAAAGGGGADRHARPADDRSRPRAAPSCSGSWPACSWRRCRSSRARTSARGPSA